jgi:cyclopropane fatty-acyl-phospholipid synthase-like methyltransferase
VLDMGCGTALSSIFLAREFGVEVWAVDLWVPPYDNFTRIREARREIVKSCGWTSWATSPFRFVLSLSAPPPLSTLGSRLRAGRR